MEAGVPNCIGATQTKATSETRFNIGSVSKLFAALAAMILVDRGLITLDTPIIDHLPTFKMQSPEYTRITTRHPLSHWSGCSEQRGYLRQLPFAVSGTGERGRRSADQPVGSEYTRLSTDQFVPLPQRRLVSDSEILRSSSMC